MKKAMMLVLLLLMMALSSNCAFSSPTYTAETLIDDWNNRFIDPTCLSSQWLSESTSPKAAEPSEKHTPRQDALHSAVEAIIQLGLETPESLSKYDDVKFGFYFIDDFNLHAWDIDLYSEQKLVYTIRIDANSGQLFSFFVNDASSIPERRSKQNYSIGTLIDQWDKLYVDSPNYSPAVYGSELRDYPLPGNDDMTQRMALYESIEMVLALSNHDIGALYDFHPYVTFDVTPVARRWHITIFQETNDTGLCDIFVFIINAMTGKLEQLTWRNVASVVPQDPVLVEHLFLNIPFFISPTKCSDLLRTYDLDLSFEDTDEYQIAVISNPRNIPGYSIRA